MFSIPASWRTPALLILLPFFFTARRLLRTPLRTAKLAPIAERVLIIGASSGIGQSIAHIYAKRGARVCVVGRREKNIEEVATECRLRVLGGDDKRILGVAADFADVDDMIRVRTLLETEWNGLDTLIIVAGVSALQPLMAVAGVEAHGTSFTPREADRDGLQRAVDVSAAAVRGNYTGPLVAAIAFIPLLQRTSPSPSVLLLNSLASVIPAPTRSIYASTKSASLLLFQALSIEHPSIAFSHILPATVEGDFRASAVDGGPVREKDPNKSGLKREYVADRCVLAVDRREKTVFMPWAMRPAHFLYWIWPSYVERMAREKYNFN
ncbi:NAD(P)-binding protein [Crucibulum laeve]|uniref:NAD(P)-binding protein n=1 Tax=Crucibulum laeve TaxID=68775 RepID=A0A5C3M0W8_9AGAR|nr:NAD(P)-binding protein [Crucibulum laeve]